MYRKGRVSTCRNITLHEQHFRDDYGFRFVNGELVSGRQADLLEIEVLDEGPDLSDSELSRPDEFIGNYDAETSQVEKRCENRTTKHKRVSRDCPVAAVRGKQRSNQAKRNFEYSESDVESLDDMPLRVTASTVAMVTGPPPLRIPASAVWGEPLPFITVDPVVEIEAPLEIEADPATEPKNNIRAWRNLLPVFISPGSNTFSKFY